VEVNFVKKALLLVCFLALCKVILFAQTGERPRTVHVTEKSAIHVPPQGVPAGLTKIYSNLGTKTDLYDDTEGFSVVGPNAGVGVTYFYAIPFTPRSNSHVSQVGVAVGYGGSGANQVNLSIYADLGGAPGTLLSGPVTVTNLPDFGTCCSLAVANFSPVAVSGGTRYWVVADTPLTGTGSDFVGIWAIVAKLIPVAENYDGKGWFGFNADYLLAGEVLGTVP
jgi:hypothetical protein